MTIGEMRDDLLRKIKYEEPNMIIKEAYINGVLDMYLAFAMNEIRKEFNHERPEPVVSGSAS